MQAVPLSAKKAAGGSAEGTAPFLQLPHFNEAVIKKIARKVCIHFLLLPLKNLINHLPAVINSATLFSHDCHVQSS